LLARALPQSEQDLRFLDAALKPGRGAPVKALAYCFCGF
jgi:protease IV